MRSIRSLILGSLLIVVIGLMAVPLSLAGAGTINDNGVNVRSGPGTDYSILNTLTKGTSITILETKGDWQQVQFGNLKGWVLSRFISAGGTPAVKTQYRLRVTGDLVNLRNGPDIGYDKVGQARKGDILTVVDVEGNWYHVKTAGGLDGYVRSDYVVKEGTASPDAPMAGNSKSTPAASYAKIVDGPANLRIAPNSSSDKITMLSKNTVYPVLGREGDWYKIRLSDGRTGYIAAWLVQATKDSAESKITTPTAPAKPPAQNEENRPDVQPSGKEQNKDKDPDSIEVKENIAEDAIRLSRSRDESGIKICMKSGAQLKGKIDTEDDQVTYEFPDRHIEGLFYFEEALGQGSLKVRGNSEDDKVVIVIQFPDETVYKTASEDGGKTEVLTIVNFIQSVEQKKFGDTGERVLITAATPVKYTQHQQGDSIIIDLKNMELGSADNEYKYDENLIKLVEVKKNGEADGGVIVTIKTGGLGKYTTGLTNNGTVLNIMMVGKNDLKARNNNLVVLDPGHGGKDPGARGAKINEKDVNLAVALKVGELLKQKGIQVEYTRTTDVFIDLEPRASAANKLNPGTFVSIHCNASPDSTIQGTETYYYAPMEVPDLFMMQDDRKALATKIHQVLVNRIARPNRGVKTANFSVLRNTDMPSTLIEIAFISNPEEEQLLMSEAFCNGAAQGIADGIAAYLGK